jgi:hypothetical protein
MRTTEEKLNEIKRRETHIRRRRFRRQTTVLSFASAAAAVLVIITAVGILPQIKSDFAGNSMSAQYASAFSGNPAIGFILVVILAFALGACITLLCVKVHRYNEREKRQ